jgi:hypothetical protein
LRGGSGPSWLTVVGDALFFRAKDDSHGEELWVLGELPHGFQVYLPVVHRQAR